MTLFDFIHQHPWKTLGWLFVAWWFLTTVRPQR